MAVLFEGKNWRIEWLYNRILYVFIDIEAHEDELFDFFADWQPLLEEKAPCLHLLNATHIRLNKLALRWELAARMKENQKHILKSALFGQSNSQAFTAKIVIKASGRKNIQLFKTQEEAEKWLLAAD